MFDSRCLPERPYYDFDSFLASAERYLSQFQGKTIRVVLIDVAHLSQSRGKGG